MLNKSEYRSTIDTNLTLVDDIDTKNNKLIANHKDIIKFSEDNACVTAKKLSKIYNIEVDKERYHNLDDKQKDIKDSIKSIEAILREIERGVNQTS